MAELKGMKGINNIPLEMFEKAEKVGNTRFDGKIDTFSVREYIKDGVVRQLAIIDCALGKDGENGTTQGIASLPMVEMVLKHGNNVVLDYTGKRYNDYVKADLPQFDLKIRV